MDAVGLDWDDVLSLAISVFALVPFAIAVAAYRRTPTQRVLMFTAAFGLFFAKGVIIALEALVWPAHPLLDGGELVADGLILLFFFLGMIKD